MDCPLCSTDAAGQLLCNNPPDRPAPAWCYQNNQDVAKPPESVTETPENDAKPPESVTLSSKNETWIRNCSAPQWNNCRYVSLMGDEMLCAKPEGEPNNGFCDPVNYKNGEFDGTKAQPPIIPAPVELTDNPAAQTVSGIALKIVITLKGESANVGIQKEGCDPVFFNFSTGGLKGVTDNLQYGVEAALEQWKKSARYPKAAVPAIVPAPVTPSTPPAAKSTTTLKPAPRVVDKPKLQPGMF
jgi:hypothetical protein